MRNPSVLSVIIPAVAVLALAGCTATSPRATPSPSVGATSASLCDPADPGTDISWSPKVDKDLAPVGYRVVTVDGGGGQRHADTHDDYVSAVDDVEGASEGEIDDAFVAALVADFARTGQTTADHFGDPGTDFDTVAVSDVPAGTYVIGYEVSQIGAKFSLSCDGRAEGPQVGELTTSEGDQLGGTLVACAEGATATGDLYRESLLEFCPAV